ncbi:ABC transporter ATP-binding protein [Anoxynatronum buryatiense]|uniref:ATP-binding cassette, subfamily B n=1 Tax=Anoxynatronum buryatiense TaxID=489973 RepID=A0AA46AKD4_9CLOT|nr:ABC transporter ATP-binding protein [Anoxynatronum buryatiense]SMP68708.1 ATP-binding cassette, subfamily B [Anoxynatronum buryatiense]
MLKKVQRLTSPESYRKYRSHVYQVLLDAIFHAFVYGMLFFALVDLVTGTVTFEKLRNYTVIMVTASVVRFMVLNKGYTGLQVEGAKIIADLRIRMGDTVRNLHMGYFNQNNIGELTNIMTNDLRDFEQLITHMIPGITKQAILSVYLALVMVYLNPRIGIIQVALLLACIPLGYYAGKRVKAAGRQAKTIRAQMLSRIIEYASGIEVFKSCHMLGDRFPKMRRSVDELKVESIRMELAGVPFIAPMQILIGLSLPVALYLAYLDFSAGGMDAQQLVMILVVSLALTTVSKGFSQLYVETRYYTLSVDKLLAVVDAEPMPFTTTVFQPRHHDIVFEGVNFAYREDQEVLKNISFTAKRNEMTALVGASGSGKSTVMNLIARFWDPREGRITIGGTDIRKVYPDSLMAQISMVFQDVYLIRDTIYENIRMGNPRATEEDVYRAARLAHCHTFIQALPDGYNTVIHEGGSTLSGGEKQRVSIARALLKDAPIILLDEATASLDADNEFEIQQAIRTLTSNKTVVVIAHRLHTIQDAEQIIVFDEGEILEKGSHDELMKQQGTYEHMYRSMVQAKEWVIA